MRSITRRPGEDAAETEAGREVRQWVHAGLFHKGQKSNGRKVTMVNGGLTFSKVVIWSVCLFLGEAPDVSM